MTLMAAAWVDDIITGISLLRLFEGVLFATQSSAEGAEAVREWIQNKQDDLSFSKWLNSISPSTFGVDSGPQQHLASMILAIALLRRRSRLQEHSAPCNLSSFELNLIWSLIHDALIALPSITVTRSSQGFLAIPLCSLVTDGNIQELFRLHPYARSWVFAGQGRDFSYQAEDVVDAERATHAKYRLGWAESDGETLGSSYPTHHKVSAVVNSGQLVRLHMTGIAMHRCDDTYAVPAGAFHRSSVEPQTFHATLFYFDSSKGFDKGAPVLGPKDGTDYLAVKSVCDQSAATLARRVGLARWEESKSAPKASLPEDEAISLVVDQT